MTLLGFIFLLVNAAALVALPRRWAPLPLLLGAIYMTGGQMIVIGPFHFTVLRLLVLVGVVRVVIRSERLTGGLNALDRLILLWGVWLLFSSVFHEPFGDALVYRLGLAYNALGVYFLIRVFFLDETDIIQLVKITAVLLIPVALEMINEKATGRNLFSYFGGVPETVMIRDDRLRAQGPFGHPILAGTVGAVCIPLMIGIWKHHPFTAKVGVTACLAMVLASTSSGPIMTTAFSIIGLLLWRFRAFTKQMRYTAVTLYIILDLIMKDPAYFLMARIDLTGSSTGWHRAQLIRSALSNINEWWLGGTDYTRHWMATGVSWSTEHTDITNHYLEYGVRGGLPLMGLFIAALYVGFRYVGQALSLRIKEPLAIQFLIWAIGACLFSHTITCLSVSYFDQSSLFLFLILATIGSLHSATVVTIKNN